MRPTNAEIAGVLAFLLATWVAFVVAGLGIATVLLNRDIITEERAGVGLGPAMVSGSLVALAGTLFIAAVRRRARGKTSSPYIVVSLFAAVMSYVGYVVTGFIGWEIFVPGNPADGFPFALHTALDWPVIVVALASLAISTTFFAYLPWRIRNIA